MARGLHRSYGAPLLYRLFVLSAIGWSAQRAQPRRLSLDESCFVFVAGAPKVPKIERINVNIDTKITGDGQECPTLPCSLISPFLFGATRRGAR